jgi:hypothetical protein
VPFLQADGGPHFTGLQSKERGGETKSQHSGQGKNGMKQLISRDIRQHERKKIKTQLKKKKKTLKK